MLLSAEYHCFHKAPARAEQRVWEPLSEPGISVQLINLGISFYTNLPWVIYNLLGTRVPCFHWGMSVLQLVWQRNPLLIL